MSTYTPDRWAVLKITSVEHGVVYKVLGTWYGGYAGSDSWKLNSGITRAEYVAATDTHNGYWDFYGYSGSVYRCYAATQGVGMLGIGVIQQAQDRIQEVGGSVEVMPDTTKYHEINYAL
jgi:hypothetical protein